MRQRRETFELADDAVALDGPRIMVHCQWSHCKTTCPSQVTAPQLLPPLQVTTPMEPREGSVASDSEEDMFDRGRQHSVLPHPAAEAPFCSTILTKEPQSE